MAIVNRKSTRDFVKRARFPKPPSLRGARRSLSGRRRSVQDQPPVQLKTKEAQALVVGGGLIVAGEKVPVQTREDLINCTLFAQLAASGEVSDSSQVIEWYNAYFRALRVLGWAQSDSQFEDYEFKSDNAEMHKAIIPVLTALLGPQAAALAVLKVALEGLQSMEENAPWITLFDRQSKSQRSARFQVATAQIDEDGILQIALIAFDLKVKANLTQVLFWKFASSSTRLRYSAGKSTIYEAALKEQRAAIAARLLPYRAAYVAQVKFPPIKKLRAMPRPQAKRNRSIRQKK